MGLKRDRTEVPEDSIFKVEILPHYAEPKFAENIEVIDTLMDKWIWFEEQMEIELIQRKDIESAFEHLDMCRQILQRMIEMTARPPLDNRIRAKQQEDNKWLYHARIIGIHETLVKQRKIIKKCRMTLDLKKLLLVIKRSRKSIDSLRKNLVILLEEGIGGFDKKNLQKADFNGESDEQLEVVEHIHPSVQGEVEGGSVYDISTETATLDDLNKDLVTAHAPEEPVAEVPYYDVIDSYEYVMDGDMGRTSEPLNLRMFSSLMEGGKTTIAVDTARYGEDRTVIAIAQGDHMVDLRSFPRQDLMETVGRVVNAIEDYKALECKIETTGGLGAGVYDRLKEVASENQTVRKCKLVPLEVQGKPTIKGEKLKAYNLRAELYLMLEEKLRTGKVSLCPDKELGEDLAHMRYKVNSLGKIQMLDKGDIKKQLGRSPDKSDATAMLFWDSPSPKLYV